MSQPEAQLVPLDDLVDGLASIKRMAFKATAGIFFTLALLSVLARAAIRWRTRRALALDDYLLFGAALFLSGATGLMYNICDNLYLSTAIRLDQSIVFRLGSERLTDLVNSAVQENHSFLIVAWTATFLVKFSFLAFFRQLIWNVAGMRRYYWVVVGVTGMAWVFLVVEPFILCSEFGFASLHCFDESKNLLYVAMTGLVTGLDALTDIMIVSIPIMILHTARMRPSQKAALGVFLCLSLVMVIFSITRVSKISGASGVDVPWVFFWQFAEASIAVLMGSLTVFRTLLIAERKTGVRGSPGGQLGKGSPAAGCGGKRPRSYYALHHRIRLLAAGKSVSKGDLESQESLPEIPGAVMTGLRTFIRRNNRDSAMGTAVITTAISQHSTLADGADEEPLRKVKEKEEKVREVGVEEMRQPNQQPGAHADSVWSGPSTQTSQTSIGGTTIHEMREA
ncbi:hypothetical protein C8A05DRAFT_47610 [Staphylotrichum tortipilum]|uniref:Rhodopsin domain-containing protein n=1 Tax=Staphylotrichum tortipilum TaxID=2831512 RepID=A0AAN6RQ11_9PEZI|nr:hypothetical protein C8A05DRAFT_47610 [Staphylotrichum longicolle]